MKPEVKVERFKDGGCLLQVKAGVYLPEESKYQSFTFNSEDEMRKTLSSLAAKFLVEMSK